MFRIDLPHLAWVLEGLVAGEVRNRITVDEKTAADAGLPSKGCSRSPEVLPRRTYPEPMTENGLTQSETADIQHAITGLRSSTARLFETLEVISDLDVTRQANFPTGP